MSSYTGEVLLLGTGTSHGVPMVGCFCPVCLSPNPKNQRTRSSILVRAPAGNILVDTTPEMRMQLVRERVDLVHTVLYTHAHADHIFGMDDLRQFGFLLDRDIPIYCEDTVAEQLQRAFSYAFVPKEQIQRRGAVPRLQLLPITTDAITVLGMTVQPLRLLHGELPVLGFRFGDLAYCTDVSQIPDESWDHLQGLQTLIIDALRFRPHVTHFNIEQALAVVEKVRPRQTYFTHICHDIEHETVSQQLPNGVELAYDGLRLRFEVDQRKNQPEFIEAKN